MRSGFQIIIAAFLLASRSAGADPCALPYAQESQRIAQSVISDLTQIVAIARREFLNPSRDQNAFLAQTYQHFFDRSRESFRNEVNGWGVRSAKGGKISCDSIRDMPVDGFLAERAVKAIICERRNLPPEKWTKESDLKDEVKRSFLPFYIEAAILIEGAASAGLANLTDGKAPPLLPNPSPSPTPAPPTVTLTEILTSGGVEQMLSKVRVLSASQADALTLEFEQRIESGEITQIRDTQPAYYRILYQIAEELRVRKAALSQAH